jgi:dienelactone hydrolase
VIITSALKDSAGGAVTEDTVFDFIRKREPLLREDGTARFSIPISDAQVEAFRNDPANSLVVGRLNTEQVRTLLRNGAAGQLDQLRRAYAPLFAAYESLFSQPREDVKLLWTFETQSTVGRLKGKRDEVRANTLRIPSNVNVDADNDGLILIPAAAHPATAQLPDSSAIGGVIEGTFDTLHFVATFPATAEASCTGVEEAGTRGLSNPFQAAPTCFRLPFTLIVPAAPGPHGVALVGHALTSSRHSLVAVANTLARLNLATVAIDFFDHGARTIDATAGPGASFVGIDLAGSRDGMLQSVLDMARLIDVLQTTDWATLLGAGHALAATEVRYVGCGLGAGFGAMLAAVEPSVSALVLNTPPAGWGKTLTESTDIGPRIRELAGTLGATTPEDVQELVVIADWLLGSSDPINYGRALRGRPVFVQTAATDTVFPSAQQDALAAEIFPGLDLPTVANYRRAETSAHCYLFDAANGGQHTVDAQTQMATFLAAPSAVGGN